MFTRQQLRELATPASFSRGQAYFEEGAVGRIRYREQDNFYSAIVSGSADYGVELSLAEDENAPDFFCDCPYNYEGICKHAVALGLAVLARNDDAMAQPPAPLKKPKQPPAPAAKQVAAPAGPSAAELERAIKEVSKPDKLKFLEQHLRQQPALASAFVLHFYDSPSPTDPLDADAALPPLHTLREELRLALTRLRFDQDNLFSADGSPLPVNSYYIQRPALLEQAIGIVYVVLRPVAAAVCGALAAARLAEGLRRLQGAWAGVQATMRPAADVFWLFSGSYAYTISQSWLTLLRETGVLELLAETPFEAGEAGRCVPGLVRPVLESTPPTPRWTTPKYAPYAPPVDASGGMQLLLAAAANPSLAPLLWPVLQPHEPRLSQSLRLQLAAGLRDWQTWTTLALAEGQLVPATAQRLLRFYLDRADRPALLRAANTLLGYQKEVVGAFVLMYVKATEDRPLYVKALTLRALQEQEFADFDELSGLWEPEERQRFVAQVLGKQKQSFRPLFCARVLAAEHRAPEILALALKLDWHPRPYAHPTRTDQANLLDLE
ncbi:MAG: hypothetical protein H7Z21_08480, partial [Hymenobacter sp.]|nr:hypothetical protein [Hymenobacter sp.]